jgi:nucleotide-binding universal stress UspA family protein
MTRVKNLLVASDFSEPSDVALTYARELARRFDATLHVLHVAEDVYPLYLGEANTTVLPELQDEIETAARKQLDSILCDEDRSELRAKAVIRTSRSPAKAIVDYAREFDIDLLIVGTHGRGAIGHLLMGSVAERVVRTAPCPVLTVHSHEREFVLPDALVAVTHT